MTHNYYLTHIDLVWYPEINLFYIRVLCKVDTLWCVCRALTTDSYFRGLLRVVIF